MKNAIAKYVEPRLLAVLIAIFWLPRLFFLYRHFDLAGDYSISIWSIAILKSIVFDGALIAYFFTPVLLFKISGLKWNRFMISLQCVMLLALLVSSLFEPAFILDMDARYNFVAVDYLIYTHEVLTNIWESYPVFGILLGVTALFSILVFSVFRLGAPISWFEPFQDASWRKRAAWGAACVFAAGLLHVSIQEQKWILNLPVGLQEISKNGTYSIFSAYRNNSINFDRFYSTVSPEEAQAVERREIRARPVHSDGRRRVLKSPLPAHPNVVVVLMESMSARFMKSYGGPADLTPNLDELARSGLWFSETFSTGTRTVRGIEAVMLSLPPTPGQSIVRRPDVGHLYTLGTEFHQRNYRTQFVYGGRGFFDNMGPFFEESGFTVVDRSSFAQNEVSFETAWGVCDEDLFDQSISLADQSVREKKPFLQVILTTSNHRPYRYPDGRVSTQSGTTREGAIQYSDYSIGRFIQKAKTRPWFDETIFVFVADHNASVAGGVEVQPRDYLIPMIFYAPMLLKPTHIREVASQIDLGPTLYDLLGWKYDQDRFFGSSILSAPAREAFMGTYQNIGRMKGGEFVLLKPRKKVEYFRVNSDWTTTPLAPSESRMQSEIAETISDYALASDRFTSGKLKMVQ